MPCERTRAVNNTRQFLIDLMNPKSTPRVPSEVRKQAYQCLRHYPGEYYMDLAKEQSPEIFGDWEDFYVKDEQAPEPFGDGDWDAGIIHDDG